MQELRVLLLSLDKAPQPRHTEARQVLAGAVQSYPCFCAFPQLQAGWLIPLGPQTPAAALLPPQSTAPGQHCSPLQGEGQQSEPALTNLLIKTLGMA